MNQCPAYFRVPTRWCRQYCFCTRELGHPGFCQSSHYGWPFPWLHSHSS
jgi:hypothetical protein